jgi:hypothetical protein
MPKEFEELRRQKGAKVRTVTKGPHKGKLIAIKGKKTALGHKRGK